MNIVLSPGHVYHLLFHAYAHYRQEGCRNQTIPENGMARVKMGRDRTWKLSLPVAARGNAKGQDITIEE
jgi:hypothetical protein